MWQEGGLSGSLADATCTHPVLTDSASCPMETETDVYIFSCRVLGFSLNWCKKPETLGPREAELNEENPALSLRELSKVHGRSQPVVQKEKHMTEITVPFTLVASLHNSHNTSVPAAAVPPPLPFLPFCISLESWPCFVLDFILHSYAVIQKKPHSSFRPICLKNKIIPPSIELPWDERQDTT